MSRSLLAIGILISNVSVISSAAPDEEQNGAIKLLWSTTARSSHVSLSLDGKSVTMSDYLSSRNEVYEVGTGKLLRKLPDGQLNGGSPDGRIAVVMFHRVEGAVVLPSVTLVNANDGKPIDGFQDMKEHVLGFTPDSATLITTQRGDERKSLKLWETATGRMRHEISTGSFHDFALSPDGNSFALTTRQGGISLWDLAKQQKRWAALGKAERAEGAERAVQHLCFAPDGKSLVTCGSVTQIWHAASGRELLVIDNPRNDYHYLATFLPGGGRLALSGANGELQLWDVAKGIKLREVKNCLLNHDGVLFARASEKGLAVANFDTGIEIGCIPIKQHVSYVQAAADYRSILVVGSSGSDPRIQEFSVWSLPAAKP